MKEIKEILAAVQDNGISNYRLDQIRQIHGMLGKLLDSVQSEDGITSEAFIEARDFVNWMEEEEKKEGPEEFIEVVEVIHNSSEQAE